MNVIKNKAQNLNAFPKTTQIMEPIQKAMAMSYPHNIFPTKEL